jgi:hypothetical protein
MREESQLFIILRKGCRNRKSPSDLEQVKSKADDRQPLLPNFAKFTELAVNLGPLPRLPFDSTFVDQKPIFIGLCLLFKSTADHRQPQEDGPPV